MSVRGQDPVVVAARRHPHEVVFAAAAAISGLIYTFGAPAPGSIDALLPVWVLHAWYGLLLAGGAVGLAGVWYPDIEVGLNLERAGMWALTSSMLIYCTVAVGFGGWRAIGIVLWLGAWAAANVARAVQIGRDLHRIAVNRGERGT